MQACFRMSYDHLIVSVGSVNNTFGVSGVEENCFFFKSIGDANRLRRQISECFERAALPYTPEDVRSSHPDTPSRSPECFECAALPYTPEDVRSCHLGPPSWSLACLECSVLCSTAHSRPTPHGCREVNRRLS